MFMKPIQRRHQYALWQASVLMVLGHVRVRDREIDVEGGGAAHGG